MGYKKVSGYCPECNQNVLLICPVPRHGLHLALSVLSLGLWAFVWIGLSLKAHHCQCSQCKKIVVFSAFLKCPIASLSQPWLDRKFGYNRVQKQCNFNSVLIENGLVYYASTRSIHL